jgi:hypothetical protein
VLNFYFTYKRIFIDFIPKHAIYGIIKDNSMIWMQMKTVPGKVKLTDVYFKKLSERFLTLGWSGESFGM